MEKVKITIEMTVAEFEALPDDYVVSGSLNLEGTGITALPEGLTVGGYLDLEGTGVTNIPASAKIGGAIYR